MSMLASLVRAYGRLPDAPPFGFSTEKIGYCILLNNDGSVRSVEDLRAHDKQRSPKPLPVPQPWKKTSGIKPNFLWEKTGYALGVTAGEGKRTQQEHQAFIDQHRDWLANTEDEGLQVFLRFLERWQPTAFQLPLWPDEMKDQSVVFALADQYREGFLHDRPAALAIWQGVKAEGALPAARCLVTGETAPIARLHPSIKGVWGAQTSGASIVSFNSDAYESYGHEQGANAPVSEAAAFAYTAALNRFLAKGSQHRVQIGDTATVFWVDCADAQVADVAQEWAGVMFGEAVSADEERLKVLDIRDRLLRIRDGERLSQVEPALADGVRMYVLGLAPNAARLSVRFYWEDDFGVLAARYAQYLRDIAIQPGPRQPVFSIRSAVLRTAPAEVRQKQLRYDADRTSPLLAGELLRAIISGGRFPRALLALLLMRIRSDHVLDPIRVSLIKGLVIRDMRLDGRLPVRPDGSSMEDYLMQPDPSDPQSARRLGRLFALIERAQAAALGDDINASVKDKFLSVAAATPARIFPTLVLNAEQHHIRRLRNGHSDAKWIKSPDHARSVGFALSRDIEAVMADLPGAMTAQHSAEEQGLFLIGYYQERHGRRKQDNPDDEPEAAVDDTEE